MEDTQLIQYIWKELSYRFPVPLLLVSLTGCYACAQYQPRCDVFFGNTNGGGNINAGQLNVRR